MQLNRIKNTIALIRKKNTIKNYDFLFTRFNDELGKRELESITPDEILSFLTRLTEGNNQTTKRNRYSSLKAFFNYILKRDVDASFKRFSQPHHTGNFNFTTGSQRFEIFLAFFIGGP